MINPVFTHSPSARIDEEDGGFSSTWSPTKDERRRIHELQNQKRESAAMEHFLQFGSGVEPSMVLDGFLFLGNIHHGCNFELLERFKIVHIINVSETDVSERFPPNQFDIVYIPMDDEVRTNIKQYFDRTNQLLHTYYMKNERCLVHCAAGVSRSATIVLAYLMKYHHNTLKEAFDYLIEKRPQIWPNEGFMLQLLRYENELIKAREIGSTVGKNDASLNFNEISNPIEALDEFKDKEEMSTLAK